MNSSRQSQILEKIRSNLGRAKTSQVPPVPLPRPSREFGDSKIEVDLLVNEINKLSGEAKNILLDDFKLNIKSLVETELIKKAVTWDTPFLNKLGIKEILNDLGVEFIPNDSDKHILAECDLGITEVDFAIPDTGTICLLASPQKPAVVSLLPRVHLAIVEVNKLRPDLHQVLDESKKEGYLVFITGPSRTSDIELTLALGVHGPHKLSVWVIS